MVSYFLNIYSKYTYVYVWEREWISQTWREKSIRLDDRGATVVSYVKKGIVIDIAKKKVNEWNKP